MTRRITMAAAVAAVAFSPVAAGAVTSPELNDQDRTFLVQAHQANLAEIQAGKAAGEAVTDEVRELGAMLVRDHTTLDRAVEREADQAGVDLPDAPNPQQRAALAQVKAKSGEDFDQAWVASQITGHRQTLAAIDEQLRDGASAEVKKVASDARPVVQMHLDTLLRADEAH
ncbi:DUF4142 domain-containing protein [Nonomuraea aridisoli]|uniref:DUF4142 domain-containing protein n=1 Tax=Nonomuraea aridisoli TaxID=2070368 RepID=A0A2W2DAI5_9ACTN|nr:DUF4142 domain-containing protein [Nonomuraea aridisoli]PZG09062.1 hypothetical protein C1J01_38105 [Nonomuraea aridisoli]